MKIVGYETKNLKVEVYKENVNDYIVSCESNFASTATKQTKHFVTIEGALNYFHKQVDHLYDYNYKGNFFH